MQMRIFVLLAALLALGARAQGVPDAFEIAQRFADSDAPQIALERIEQLQPAATTAPRWGDWEQLRCSLMRRLNRHQDLVRRVAALPAGAPAKTARFCLLQGARAAIAISQGAGARDFLARLIWRQELSEDEWRQARQLVIESYLAESKSQDAYALMLRYQQDFKPVDKDTASRFVDALLAAGMEKEAVNWFSLLDDASPVKLLMRLKSGLITPDAAIAQALAKSGASAAHWIVLQHAAELQKNSVLQVEALENLLQLLPDKPAERAAAVAADLWKAYAATAQELANQDKLLLGDDANWADYAARRAATSPVMARVFHAYLATQSKVRATRQSAQLQLAYSLQGSRLALTAVRLFDDAARFPAAQLDDQTRYLLGAMAVDTNQISVAARFWFGLGVPATLTPEEWNLRLAQALIRAGAADAGADALRALMAGKKSLPPETVQRAILPVQELQDTGFFKTANELYLALMPLAEARERREILSGLGRIAESNNDFQRAADYFLEAALLLDARATDSFSVHARISAASNLGRAGLKDDARAQFGWLQKNVKDPDRLELIRREMQKL
jgi:hypothetical protein